MYEFIKNQWIMRKYDTENVANCVAKGFITQTQADEIEQLSQMEA